MPQNKFQKFLFGLIMSYAMAYGMEREPPFPPDTVTLPETIRISVRFSDRPEPLPSCVRP